MIPRLPCVALLLICSCSLRTMGGYTGSPDDGAPEPDAPDVLDLANEDEDIDDDAALPDQPVDGEEDAAGDLEEIEYPAGWLEGWRYRLPLAIDAGDIDEGLQNFPLLVHLSDSSGIDHVSVIDIFRQLQDNAHRFMIAVTDLDGMEFDVEIEEWEDNRERAWLWVGVPYIDPDLDTVIYLYYDVDHPENRDHVDDTGTPPAQRVWDGYYEGVWHLALVTAAIKDSTANRKNGVPQGGMSAGTSHVDDMLAGAIQFDGIDDYIDVGSIESSSWSAITLEAWFYADVIDDDRLICKATGANLADHVFSLGVYSNGANRVLRGRVVTDGGDGLPTSLDSEPVLDASVWTYATFAWGVGDHASVVFIDGQNSKVADNRGATLANANPNVCIGNINDLNIPDDNRFFQGKIDEVRISSIRRSDAWIKASYESGIDNLVRFGSLETLP